MSPLEVVRALIAEGVQFSTDGRRITWCNDDGWMKPEVVVILKSGKAEVIAFLVSQAFGPAPIALAEGHDSLSTFS